MKILTSCLTVVILLTSFWLAGCQLTPSQDLTEEVVDQLTPIKINDHLLNVEIVDRADSITLGLGNRDEIGSDGMLFVLPDRQIVTFWMYQMRFPLDIVWIDQDQVIGLTSNVPAPDPQQTPQRLPTYPSPGKVTHVLEIAAGRAAQLGLSERDQVSIGRPI